jgi:integrase
MGMDIKFFNSEIKNKFLGKFENADTQDVYSRIFKKSSEIEFEKDKDLYDFEDSELESFIENQLKPKTKESARTYCNVLSSYIQWAIENKYSSQLVNPIRRRQEYFYNFVQENKLYINVHEKDDILRMLLNRQDGFIIQGLWEGIQGNQVCELVNLKVTDINPEEKTIILRDNKGNITRVLTDVEDKTIDMALLANKEEEYYKRNGEVDFSSNVKEVARLPKSEYVLKGTKTNPKGGGKKISHYTVYNRLDMIKSLEEFEEYADALTTKNIVRSGMIYMAMKLLKRDGKLERKQIEEICERFGMKYKWSLKDFLNEQTVKELYPDEFK